ncbi:uncharacterized protein RAG0_06943 [Rhynchosporium agropyri]|uniref:Uncharacterized protein n=1 Tax=Rhynchosporium agropyri TaxID=914238 RepID=A0A1E1KJ45_9HELO|nr:uncharacterized protein RAG0_06943 [Rhynchosporium agropyri]
MTKTSEKVERRLRLSDAFKLKNFLSFRDLSLFSFKTCYWLAHSTVCFGRPESLDRVRLKAEKVQQAIANNRKAVSNDQANDDSKDTYDQNTAHLLYDNLLQHDDCHGVYSTSTKIAENVSGR